MRCGRMRRLLSAYMDERIPAGARMAAGLHLSRCPDCRRRFEELRRFRLALLESARVEAPAGFAVGWRSALRREAERPAPARRRTRSLGAARWVPAAACLLLMAGVAVLLRPLQNRYANLPQASPPTLKAARLAPSAAPPPPKPSAAPPVRPQAPAMASSGAAERGAASAAESAGLGGAPVFSVDAARRGAGNGAASQSRLAGGAEGSRIKSALPPAARKPSAAAEGAYAMEGTWRVWLVSVGSRPAAIQDVLADAGFSSSLLGRIPLDVPWLVCQGLSYGSAQDLARRLEDAGGRAAVELAGN